MDNNIPPKPITENNPDGAGAKGWWETDPNKLTQLEIAFGIGCTDEEATIYADISMRQLYYYQKINPDFVIKKERLKQRPILTARKTVFDNLNNIGTASWYLERKRKDEFSARTEVENTTKISDETVKKIDDLMTDDTNAEITETPNEG